VLIWQSRGQSLQNLLHKIMHKQLLDEKLTFTSTRSNSLSDDFYECVICDNMVIEPDGQICCICSSLCHKKCLIELDEIYTCVACVASNESINQLKRTFNDASMFSALDHTTYTEETLVSWFVSNAFQQLGCQFAVSFFHIRSTHAFGY
jgi:hypothetical protein